MCQKSKEQNKYIVEIVDDATKKRVVGKIEVPIEEQKKEYCEK